jgi:hypothetical protein
MGSSFLYAYMTTQIFSQFISKEKICYIISIWHLLWLTRGLFVERNRDYYYYYYYRRENLDEKNLCINRDPNIIFIYYFMCVLLNIEFFIAINHFLKWIFRPFIYIVFRYCLIFRKFIKKFLWFLWFKYLKFCVKKILFLKENTFQCIINS